MASKKWNELRTSARAASSSGPASAPSRSEKCERTGWRFEPELGESDDVVADSILHGVPVGRTTRPFEPMQPPQKRQAERPVPPSPELFVKVSLLATEPDEPRVETGPCGAPAAEETGTLHRYLERLAVHVVGPLIVRPRAEHRVAPDGLHVRHQLAQVVVTRWALEQVSRVGMCINVVEQLA